MVSRHCLRAERVFRSRLPSEKAQLKKDSQKLSKSAGRVNRSVNASRYLVQTSPLHYVRDSGVYRLNQGLPCRCIWEATVEFEESLFFAALLQRSAKYANEYFKRKHDCDIENVYLLFEIRSGFALNTYSRLRISRHERSGAIRVPLGADCAVSESSFLASVRKISIFYSRYGMEKNK